ncbi:M23 family metallopeptidase [Prosthecomicrobium sp. N25]|uniref:M23 family metallopeptidase n=1 Tax=Prosthecomicrobium sp. N25 TaxID=3129254 RepID=UPI003078A0BE
MTTTSTGHRSFGKRAELPRISFTANGRERSLTLTPAWMLTGAAAVVLFTLAYLGATGYLMFRDDILGAALARQASLQQSYEDRIAALRAQIDRINSRQLLDQEAFEAKIDRLMARQEAMKEQDMAIAAVIERARQSGLKVPAAAPTATLEPERTTPAPAVQPAPLRSSSWFDPFSARGAKRPDGRVATRIATAEDTLDRLVARRTLAVSMVAEMAERDASRIESAVGRLGLRLAMPATERAEPVPRPKPVAGVGGPLVPAMEPVTLVRRAETALARLVAARRSAAILPLGVPVAGDPTVTSGYGNRSDPFFGVLAMHTGIDFRAETGDPVLATGPGTVSDAGRNGGYGLMVEIDHGSGVSTRFGHLSRIAVEPGTVVRRGQVIGYAGSTGRSTGPHVHYETRINGDAVDPARWVDAGEAILPLLK